MKNSNLNLNKYFAESISKSEITCSNPSISNIKNSDFRKSSMMSNEESNNKNKKVDKSKLYINKRISNKLSKKRISCEDNTSSRNSSQFIESCISNKSINADTRRSLAPKNINNYNDPFFKSMNHLKLNQKKNNKKFYKQISLQKDKLNVLKKFNDKYNIFENDIKNDKKRKSFHKKNKKINDNNNVGLILKDLQEKIKNTLILRPEDLDINDEPIRRKSKGAKEKDNINTLSKFSKKEIGSFRKSQEFRFSKKSLIDNENKNESEKDKQKISEEQNKINNINIKMKTLKKVIYLKIHHQIL